MTVRTFEDWESTRIITDTLDANQVDRWVRAAYAAGVAAAQAETSEQKPADFSTLRVLNVRHPRESDEQHALNTRAADAYNRAIGDVHKLGPFYSKPCTPA